MSVPFLNVKPHAFKIKVQVRFPADTRGGVAVDVYKLNGTYTINWDLSKLVPTVTIPDPSHAYFGFYNSITNIYNTIAATDLLAGASVIPDPAWSLRGNPTPGTAFAVGFAIDSLASKPVPQGADKVIIEDGTDHSLKSVDLVNLNKAFTLSAAWSLRGNPTNTFATTIDFTIGSVPNKAIPAGNDQALISDIAGGTVFKNINLADLPKAFAPSVAWTLRGNPTGGNALVSDFTIGSLANKAVPVNADRLMVQDGGDGSLKNILLSAITAALTAQPAWTLWGNPTGAPATQVSFTVDGLTLKAVPVAADEILIADSAAAFGFKKALLSAVSSKVSTAPAWTFKGNPTAAVALPTDFGIDGLAAKVQLVAADEAIIADSAAAFGFKKVAISNIGIAAPAWTLRGNPTAAPANPVDFTIDGLTLKSLPVFSDEVMIADSAAAFGYKKAAIWTLANGFQISPPQTLRGNPTSASVLYTDFTIGSLTLKAVPVSNDNVMIEDSTTVPPSLVRTTVSGLSAGGSLTGAVRYDAAQGLSAEPQQRQGRQNIYAAPFDALAYNGMQINGSFDVSQETGHNGTSINGNYVCDGWRVYKSGTMVFGGAQTADAVTFPGFQNYLLGSVPTAQAVMGASDGAAFYQRIEGYRFSRLAWGTTSAQPLTIAFWSMHHRTGVYSVTLSNGTSRSYAATYTQAAADVPQYNVITILGDSGGPWAADNSFAVQVMFAMAAGATITAPVANAWSAANYVAAPGQVNAVAATSDIFRLAGFIALPGIEAPSAGRSPFIMRSFDQELILAQRYWEKTYNYATLPGATGFAGGYFQIYMGVSGSTVGNNAQNVPFRQRKRAAPAVVPYSPQTGASNKAYDANGPGDVAPGLGAISETGFFGNPSPTTLLTTMNISWHWTADARL